MIFTPQQKKFERLVSKSRKKPKERQLKPGELKRFGVRDGKVEQISVYEVDGRLIELSYRNSSKQKATIWDPELVYKTRTRALRSITGEIWYAIGKNNRPFAVKVARGYRDEKVFTNARTGESVYRHTDLFPTKRVAIDHLVSSLKERIRREKKNLRAYERDLAGAFRMKARLGR